MAREKMGFFQRKNETDTLETQEERPLTYEWKKIFKAVPILDNMEEEPALPRKVAMAFYIFLLILGIMMYVGWGIYYGSWNILAAENIGVYAIVVIMVGFGIAGILLYSRP